MAKVLCGTVAHRTLLKFPCQKGFPQIATYFVQRRQESKQIAGGEILAFCKDCFWQPVNQGTFADWAFPRHLYWRFGSVHGINHKAFNALDLSRCH